MGFGSILSSTVLIDCLWALLDLFVYAASSVYWVMYHALILRHFNSPCVTKNIIKFMICERLTLLLYLPASDDVHNYESC